MRKILARTLAALALAMAPGPASAATVGVSVYGAVNGYALADFNDGLRESNSTLGTSFDEVRSGATGGMDLRVWPSRNWMIAAGWEPLFARAENDRRTPISFDLRADAFTLTGACFFPTRTPAWLGLGAGVGYYRMAGELAAPELNPTADLTGSTVGFHALGLLEWPMASGFTLLGALGYRVARVDDTRLDGQSSVPPSETDYSGVFARAGFALCFDLVPVLRPGRE